MGEDALKKYPEAQVAAWYGRLAAGWQQGTPELKPSLAALFLQTWLNNRNPSAKIPFDAPSHLRSNNAVFSVQAFHRKVVLTEEKGRFSGGKQRWVGILPRIQGAAGFKKWDMKTPLSLSYESLCDPAPDIIAIAQVQKFGTSGERDVFGSLRGFQLKSEVTVEALPSQSNRVTIKLKSWTCSATDRYDWNYSEYLTVVNPDYQSKAKDAIHPTERTITVYHSNAKRLEDAGLAAPYDVVVRPWAVVDATLLRDAVIDTSRKL